jgi:hypothetical protein
VRWRLAGAFFVGEEHRVRRQRSREVPLPMDFFNWQFRPFASSNTLFMKIPKRSSYSRLWPAISLTLIASIGAIASTPSNPAFRPPAVPLVTCDPYFSIWSPADKLTDSDTVHWTGKRHRLTSLARIDGKAFRLIGTEPSSLPALAQINLEVLPTRTIYSFADAGVKLTLTFLTPMLPDDLDVLARPVTYMTWTAQATDGKAHTIQVYFDARPEIAVNEPAQRVIFKPAAVPDAVGWSVGSEEQPVLQKKGDDLRIDWGYFYAVSPKELKPMSLVAESAASRENFASHGELATSQNGAASVPASQDLVIALALNLGEVKSAPVSRWLVLAYDDLYSIQYMSKNLRPYWRRKGWEAADLLKASIKDYASLQKRCEKFDSELMADVTKAGGENYARLAALAYRQCFAAGKFVADGNGQPMQFCKENHSNGCIGTSDVFYPMAPQFLLFGPTLAKSFLVPFMNYAASERWKFPFAPHDLGTYPKANGQVYGGGERTEENQMPVEESGNLLILLTAVAEMEGKPDFANLYWRQLERWASYLSAKGFDPENQLCTDDFAGHLAHNVNLSAKAICGLGAFARLCEMRGDKAKAEEYFKLARGFAQRWVKEADDGDHYRLAFDKPGTWSQKYNLIWDRILGLNLFPAEVARKEMAFYRKNQNDYGLPLDNRKAYTKLDWITWTGTLTQDQSDFEALIDPVCKFLNETSNRSPMTDWYQTKTAAKVGFTARPVVGGVFARMLYDKPVWQKYARRDRTLASGWAAIPSRPKLRTILPAADVQPAAWRYTTAKPSSDWYKSDFDASSWQEGRSGFGTPETPGAVIGTTWNGSDIWLRRSVELPQCKLSNVLGWLHHDEDAEVYVNGVMALRARGYSSSYEAVDLNARGSAALKPGTNTIAIHCHQTFGGQFIDFGLVESEAN